MSVNNEKLKMVQFCLFAAFVLDIALMYLVGKNFPMLLESYFFNQFYIIHFIFPSLVAVLILKFMLVQVFLLSRNLISSNVGVKSDEQVKKNSILYSINYFFRHGYIIVDVKV